MKGPFYDLEHPREIVRNFIPGWFAVNMGTGITGIVIANSPFPFHGMVIIGSIFFLANVSLFCLFTILFVARILVYPETIPPLLRHHQSLMLSTIPMGLTTITNYVVLVLVPTHSWALELAYVLWWTEFSLTLLSIFGIPYCMMRHQEHKIDTMNAMWLLPLVPAVVTGASGCYLSRYLESEGHRAPMIFTISSMTLGCGLSLALPLIGVYFYRLMAHDLPPGDVIITSFLPVGPLGQGTYGIIEMGWAAQKVIGDKWAPGFGDGAFTCCLIMAFFLWAYGLWYLCFAVASLSVRLRTDAPFNMGWWGLTFPIGVYTAGTLNIAIATNSRFFHGATAFLICSLVLIWFYVATQTLRRIYSGKVFRAPCLQQVPFQSRMTNHEMQRCDN
ncbi:Plasma membrane sulfite pump involved in sulfite metabolism [Basidiobolus ranarum]|uniref:Plasma membrane sulfite pump involved in sulfite metabolism n=1 Tax=Basidiobolus ranarum TaxID=34480 RepID=A0ABR2WHZ4_9FUNG